MVKQNENTPFEVARATMIVEQLEVRNISEPKVLKALAQLPREEFVSSQYSQQAYHDRPLPIGLGQTISQPYMVALMTQILDIDSDCQVLEIGTGCGYQTAVLAMLAEKVFTVERFSQLQEMAIATLGRLEFGNIEFLVADGSRGWNEAKKFDRIIVTAAAPNIPQSLLAQLKDGGKMVLPIGNEFSQEISLVEKKQGEIIKTKKCLCRFVKLIGEQGFKETL